MLDAHPWFPKVTLDPITSLRTTVKSEGPVGPPEWGISWNVASHKFWSNFVIMMHIGPWHQPHSFTPLRWLVTMEMDMDTIPCLTPARPAPEKPFLHKFEAFFLADSSQQNNMSGVTLQLPKALFHTKLKFFSLRLVTIYSKRLKLALFQYSG